MTALVYGTLRFERAVDAQLGPLLKRPDRLPEGVQGALRLGVFEILYRGTPRHAAANAWTEIVKRAEPRLAGLANAVLRRVERLELSPGTAAGLPEWLYGEWVDRFGAEQAGAVAAGALIMSAGFLDDLSVMREYAARRDTFWREAQRHLMLAFGSLGAALAVGLPLGILVHEAPRLRGAVLGVLNVVQTIPSLALFGIMIPLFGWIAASVPGAAAAGIAGIGAFPALVALFLYSLLPVVSNEFWSEFPEWWVTIFDSGISSASAWPCASGNIGSAAPWMTSAGGPIDDKGPRGLSSPSSRSWF